MKQWLRGVNLGSKLVDVIYANPVILGGLFANGKGMDRYLPMLNRQRNNKMLWTR